MTSLRFIALCIFSGLLVAGCQSVLEPNDIRADDTASENDSDMDSETDTAPVRQDTGTGTGSDTDTIAYCTCTAMGCYRGVVITTTMEDGEEFPEGTLSVKWESGELSGEFEVFDYLPASNEFPPHATVELYEIHDHADQLQLDHPQIILEWFLDGASLGVPESYPLEWTESICNQCTGPCVDWYSRADLRITLPSQEPPPPVCNWEPQAITTCPAECTGGCADGVCHIDCSGTSSCQGAPIFCPEGMPCHLDCSGLSSCQAPAIICPPHAPCTVACTGISACGAANLICGDGECGSQCTLPSAFLGNTYCGNSCDCYNCHGYVLLDTDTTPAYIDLDGDGWSPPEDCDDANPAVHMGQEEIIGNGIDENCDGSDGAT